MRNTAAAVILAIAASNIDPIYGQLFDEESGKSGKSGGTKSSKSDDCTYCSADTLTRATMVSNLFVSNLGDENGDITQASIAEFCNEGPEATAAFLEAGDNAAGCLVHFECGFQNIVDIVYSGENNTITEGFVRTNDIDGLCDAEQNGVILPEGGCPDYIDPCETINNGGGGGLLGGPAEEEEPLVVWFYWQQPTMNVA